MRSPERRRAPRPRCVMPAHPSVAARADKLDPSPCRLGAGIRPIRPAGAGACGLHRDQPRLPVRPQYQQHPHLHRRARSHRAGDDVTHDRGRIRSLRRVAVWICARRHVDAVQCRLRAAERRIFDQPRGRGADRARQRTVRDEAQDPVLPRHARHAARRPGHGAVCHQRISATHLERWRAMARQASGRRLLRRTLPGLRLVVLVRRRRADPRLPSDGDQVRQLDPGHRRQRQRRTRARCRRFGR